LYAEGPAVVILSSGSAGASAYLASGDRVRVPVNPTQVVDTVGAGDTFNAGVLTYLSEHSHLTKSALSSLSKEDAKAALSFGADVAGLTVSRAGANPPWRRELEGQIAGEGWSAIGEKRRADRSRTGKH